MRAFFDFSHQHKKTFQRVTIAFFILFLLTVVDSICFALFESKTVFKVIAGGQIPISGKLVKPVDVRNIPKRGTGGEFDPQGVQRLNRLLTYEPSQRGYYIQFTGLEGRIWHGLLQIESSALPGEFGFNVFASDNPPVSAESSAYRVIIYPDLETYRRSFFCLSKRWLGINPWWLSLLFLPVSILFFIAVFRATAIEDAKLQANGIGPIYKLAKRKEHWEVIFGLGHRHGVQPGDTLLILDPKRQPAGQLPVEQVHADYSTARVSLEERIRADYLIARPVHQTGKNGSDEIQN
jgi:hypothetical protein